MLYKNVHIEAFGYEIPETMVTSQSLEERVAPVYEKLNLSYGRFELMTGIRERRFWDDETTPSQASTKAAEKAIRNREGGHRVSSSYLRMSRFPGTGDGYPGP